MTGAEVERRIATILFADLVGFTTFAESLDPEDVATVQSSYFSVVRETVARHGGTIEKFIGDAVMAVFGVPLAHDDDAERAVRAALALVAAVDSLGVELGLESALALRVGVNSGEVVGARELAPDRALVTGDPVQVAVRLQAAARPGTVLVGETTALAVADGVELDPADELALKGKREPVRACRALALRPEPSRDHALAGLAAPMLGRDGELALLAEALERARRGGSERWLVVAPPGIGKSRLLFELGEAAAGVRVWPARVRSFQTSPYEPVAQLLRAALAGAGLADPAVPESEASERARSMLVERLLAAGGSEASARATAEEAVALVWPGSARRAAERDAAFAAWTAALEALAAGTPALWLVEDVHWASSDLLDFLAQAASASTDVGRLVVTSARPSLLERATAWCDVDEPGGPRVLDLPPLADSATEELVRELVGHALPADLLARVVAGAGGTPLFVEELLRTWISARTLVADSDGWHLAAAPDVPLPQTVQAVYAAQLDDLPAAARDVARRAAVAGRRFPAEALGALDVADPAAGLDVLRARALLEGPLLDPSLGETYAYRHALLRDAAYASLARAERARLHVSLAGWLERRTGDDSHAAVVGGHYSAALEAAPALAIEVAPGITRPRAAALAAAALERGGEHALREAAHDTASDLFGRAVELTPDATLDRARRLTLLGDATAAAADTARAADAAAEAMAICHSLVDGTESHAAQRTLVRAAASLGAVRLARVQFAEARELADEVLAAAQGGGDAAEGRLRLVRAIAAMALTNDAAEADEDVGRTLEIARASGDRSLELSALAWFFPGRAPDRAVLTGIDFRRVEALAEELGRWATLTEALENRALERLDDYADEAFPILDRAAEIAGVRVLTENAGWVDYVRTEALLALGRWEEARAAGLRAIELGDRHGYQRLILRSRYPLLLFGAPLGDREVLEPAWDWWSAVRGRLPPTPFGLLMITGIELSFVRAGYEEPFVPDLAPLLPSLRITYGTPSRLEAVDVLVGRWLDVQRRGDARRAVEEFEAATTHPAMSERSRAHAALLRARLAAAEGRPPEEIRAHAEHALGGFRLCRWPWGVERAEAILSGRGTPVSA